MRVSRKTAGAVGAGLTAAAAAAWFFLGGPTGSVAAADGAAATAFGAPVSETAPSAAAGGSSIGGLSGAPAPEAASLQETLSAAEQAILDHERADRGPEQPIPFSHRFHATDLRIDCEYCHTGARTSSVVRMPPLSTCMGCHQFVGSGLEPIEELRGYASRGAPVPWQRVYKVPEFVQFKHQPHLRNELECAECHGPVEEMDRIYRAADLTMGWCLTCHRQEPQPTDVATDYRLVRDFPPPETPSGRQPIGLYPTRVSSGYAAARAPTDCAACHY